MSTDFLAQDSQFRGRYSSKVFQTIRVSYRPYQYRILLLLVFGLLGRILMLSNANLISQYADPNSDHLGIRQLTGSQFVLLLCVVTGTGFLLSSAFRVFFSRLSARAVSRLYDEVTLRTSRLPMTFYDTNPVGRIVTRFSSDYGNVFRLFGGPLAEFLSIIFDLIAMTALVAWSSSWMLGLFVCVGLIQGLIFRLNQGRLRLERRNLAQVRAPSIAHFAETAQGATSIRIYDRLETFVRRFDDLNGQFISARWRTSSFLFGFSLQMGLVTAGLFFSAGALAIWFQSEQLITVGALGAGFAFIMLSANSVQMFFEWLSQFEEAMTGVERLSDYLHRDLEPGAKLPLSAQFDIVSARQPREESKAMRETRIDPGLVANQRIERESDKLTLNRSASVEFRSVQFRYGPAGPMILNDVSFRVEAGEKFGIIGRTGSGKSSLVQALYRFYPVEHGEILIAGRAPDLSQQPRELDLAAYRRSIAYISQDPTLFRGRLRENLDLEGRHSDALLIECLERVELGAWFRALPQGLNEQIEERGRNLSSGERQLVCMARCLLQEAPVVIMDEATSAIDPATESVLVKATDTFFAGRTQIIIAHRLSTLLECDRILWLDAGQVKLIGRAETVLAAYRLDQSPELV